MRDRRTIELLSPAKNAECAIAAIKAGADAVYMGASSFGARSLAGNSFDAIKKSADFAHLFGARVYITLNTILFDGEVEKARETAFKAYESGADALIIQDMGLMNGELPPIELHASTQCNIRTPEKAKFLEDAGFDTLVLARELSLKEIESIAKSVKARIECFVHGALCVSYSGQCYLSHAIGGRSGNRGECAQPCRMPYLLEDFNGKIVSKDAHFLSLKDMNRSKSVGEMLKAGASSFKIEGRLKDLDYVKNITAYYRKILDAEIEKNGLCRASFGRSRFPFEPNPSKTFNRGFCEYFLKDMSEKCASFDTPKSKGEFIGKVENPIKGGFETNSKELQNGDGILIKNPDGRIFGTLVNFSKNGKIKCASNCPACRGAEIWRNKSVAFEAQISGECSRKIGINAEFSETPSEYKISFSHPPTNSYSEVKINKGETEPAQNFDAASERISASLQKSGGTNFEVISLKFSAKSAPFLKASEINEFRRTLLKALEEKILSLHELKRKVKRIPPKFSALKKEFFDADYRANVSNKKAEDFYKKCGIKIEEPALECNATDISEKELMRTKHCILRELGMCKKEGKFPKSLAEPLILKSGEASLKIRFNCGDCGMSIFNAHFKSSEAR